MFMVGIRRSTVTFVIVWHILLLRLPLLLLRFSLLLHLVFYNCKQLIEVVFNKGLQKIRGCAFQECTSLSSITLPSSVTEVGDYAFHNCKQLMEVVMNEGLQKIGVGAFDSCTSLSSIKLPSTITGVSIGAFQSCSNLREVVVLRGMPLNGFLAFSNCTALERFTFPTISARVDNLIQTGYWEAIENEVDEVRGVVEWSGGELFVSAQAMGNWNRVRALNRVREDLGKLDTWISRYELKEATSLLELALWKFKLDQVDKANPIPRKKCRMDVPGPVKDIILQYFPYECRLPVLDGTSSR